MIKKREIVASTLVGPERRLSLPAFFRLFQEIAGEDSERIGLGKKQTMDKGMLWVFTRVQLDIKRMPDYMEEVEVLTYTGARRSFIFPRFCEIRDLKGNLLIRATSLWALIDEKTRHVIVRPEVEQEDFTEGSSYESPKKAEAKECEKVASKTICYSDVDLNGHLNNTRYIEMVSNLLPIDFYRDHFVSSFLINYEAEIHAGEHVGIFANEDKTYVKGMVGDKVNFEVSLAYSKIVDSL